MILDKVNSPNDVKKLTAQEMNLLADEIRQLIMKKVNTTGGHLGPNLGIVETTIAMHYVFNSPSDKIVYDVSHQCYPHKILTGRKEGFLNPENYLKFTGYTAPEESVHDFFKVGHTSTSVSLACGLAKARDVRGEKGNVIAILGDGSMSGGEALEGLNNAAVLGGNIIIAINDNDMSIAENQGGLYKNLELLRNTEGQAENNLFTAMGFEYHYLKEGNNTEKLIELFEKVKDKNHPVVLHIKTIKGLGLMDADEKRENYHWILPGELDGTANYGDGVSNNSYTRNYLLDKFKTNPDLVAITAATPGAVGFDKEFRKILGKNYVDVGIAEQHAVGYAAALATGGAKPVFFVLSSFVQRTYDQLSQDLALNNSPATLLINWCGISPMDATHLGCFDIPLISNIPNLVYLAPSNLEEYFAMLDFSISQTKFPVAIRVPLATFKKTGVKDDTDYSILNKSKVLSKGSDVAIVAVGDFLELAEKVKIELQQKGINPTIINPVYLTGLDVELLEDIKKDHKIVITLENGVLDGGFGEKVSRFYSNSNVRTLNFGANKEFTDRVPLDELYERYHLTKELIAKDVLEALNTVSYAI